MFKLNLQQIYDQIEIHQSNKKENELLQISNVLQMNFQLIEYLNELYNDIKHDDNDALTPFEPSRPVTFQIPISV